MKTQRDVLRWQVLAMAIGLFPSGRVAATELSSDYSMARVLYEGRRYSEAQDVFRRLAEDQPERPRGSHRIMLAFKMHWGMRLG